MSSRQVRPVGLVGREPEAGAVGAADWEAGWVGAGRCTLDE